MKDEWTLVAITFAGKVTKEKQKMNPDFSLNSHLWVRLVDLPNLIIDEWQDSMASSNFNRWFIYLKEV